MAPKKIYKLPVISNEQICSDIYLMTLQSTELATILQPGQFMHVDCGSSDFKLLRRPISIFDCNAEAGTIAMLYKVVGKGTTCLANIKNGEIVDLMAPLGNTFELTSQNPLLIGGGIGVAPLRYLVRAFNNISIKPTVVLGFANADQAKMAKLFVDADCILAVCSDDGSTGEQANSCQLADIFIKDNTFDAIYSCGPEIMLKNIPALDGPRYVSLEAYMACGVGACLGCAVEKTSGGYAHVCKDGPVFERDEVILHG